uniref:Uncharacterized protein n=1 Tax=Panagrolaimus sp. JU765 TaxID=591449 RepID=A0AC34RN90_9BILA
MGHEDPEKATEPNLGPNVIRIKPPPRFGMFGSMLFRMAIGLLILAAGVVAVYYSIQAHNDTNEEKPIVAKTFFTLNRTQFSAQRGVYTKETTIGKDSFGKRNHTTVKRKTIWAQDDARKRLFHSIGDQNDTDYLAYYVFPDYYLIVERNKCVKIKTGYDTFLASFGLSGLLYIRSEEIQTKELETGAEDEAFEEVNFFQGEPLIETKDDRPIPFVGFGYMDTSNSKAFAWQFYYPDTQPNNTYFEEYWYPDMVAEPPNDTYFNFPDLCF